MRTAEHHKFTKLQALAGVCPRHSRAVLQKKITEPKGKKRKKTKQKTVHVTFTLVFLLQHHI